MLDRNQQDALFPPGPGGTWRASPAAAAVEPPARRDGPDTSHGAAARIKRDAPTIRDRLHDWFVARGRRGATNEQAAEALELKQATVTARVNELCQLDLLRDSGERRRTSSGRRAIVWVAGDGKFGR